MLGLNAKVKRGSCTFAKNPEYQTETIASWAMKAGKDAGLVTTARLTDATPAGL